MRSLIYTVLAVIVATVISQYMGLAIAKNLKILEMLGTGLILGKFTLDYFSNRKSNSSYLKYSIYSAIAFIVYNIGLFSFNKFPFEISVSLLLLSLLIFSMIGVNDSLSLMKKGANKISSKELYFYLTIFAIHGLYAFVVASSFLKGYNLYFLVPGILLFDLVILVPFVIIKKAYDQFLLLALLVVSLSVNTYIASFLQSMLNNL